MNRHTGSQRSGLRRRPFLQTAAGTILLPWLESFDGVRWLSAAETQPAAPLRFVTLFFPNGVYPSAWRAEQDASGLKLSGSLEPLQPFADEAIVVTGLNNPLGGHLGQASGFLSGIDFAPDEQGTVRGATSLDQMLAQRFAAETFVPSLNLALEPPSQGGFGNRPRSYGNSISWSSPTTKIEPQINPQQAFDQVFFGQTEAGRRAACRKQRIVDAIWSEARTLENRVSTADRRKLAQYLDSIAALESKLQKSLTPPAHGWTPPRHSDATRPAGSGVPTDHAEHLRTMLEIMLLALQTDSTRVTTLVMGHEISRIVYDFFDRTLKRNHHDYSHHRNDAEKIAGYNKITTWFAGQCAWFLGRMREIDEGEGTLLDNSIVLYGSGMKDGNVHEPVDVPIVLFGRAGGRVHSGRRIDCPADSLLSQLHLSLLNLYGLDAEDFNGVTDRTIPGLM